MIDLSNAGAEGQEGSTSPGAAARPRASGGRGFGPVQLHETTQCFVCGGRLERNRDRFVSRLRGKLAALQHGEDATLPPTNGGFRAYLYVHGLTIALRSHPACEDGFPADRARQQNYSLTFGALFADAANALSERPLEWDQHPGSLPSMT